MMKNNIFSLSHIIYNVFINILVLLLLKKHKSNYSPKVSFVNHNYMFELAHHLLTNSKSYTHLYSINLSVKSH